MRAVLQARGIRGFVRITGLAVGLLCAASCASTPRIAATTSKPVSASPVPVALPEEPLLLLPSGAHQITRLNLVQLRASPQFATLRDLAQRGGCVTGSDLHFLFDRADQAALASYQDSAHTVRSVLVLHGAFGSADAREALLQASALAGHPHPSVSEQASGRFSILSANGISTVALGERLLAIGDPERVRAVVGVADAAQPNWLKDAALMPNIETARWLGEHTFSLLARLDDRSARRFERTISSMGGPRLSAGLANSSAAFAVGFGDNLHLEAMILYPDAPSAADTAEQLHGLIGQAGLMLRLFGLPPALGRPDVRTEGERLLLSLTLSADDVRTLTARLTPLFEAELPSCTNTPGTRAPGANPADTTQAQREP